MFVVWSIYYKIDCLEKEFKAVTKFDKNLDNSFYIQDRMPAGFNQHSSDIESIVGVQFSIFSPEEIERSSVVEITSQTPYEGNEPKIGGLFDPRMGVLSPTPIERKAEA